MENKHIFRLLNGWRRGTAFDHKLPRGVLRKDRSPLHQTDDRLGGGSAQLVSLLGVACHLHCGQITKIRTVKTDHTHIFWNAYISVRQLLHQPVGNLVITAHNGSDRFELSGQKPGQKAGVLPFLQCGKLARVKTAEVFLARQKLRFPQSRQQPKTLFGAL